MIYPKILQDILGAENRMELGASLEIAYEGIKTIKYLGHGGPGDPEKVFTPYDANEEDN